MLVKIKDHLGAGDPGVPGTDGLGEGRHGEVGHGAALELNVDHLGVADVVIAVVDTPDLQYRVSDGNIISL